MTRVLHILAAVREQLPPRKYDRSRIELLEAENRLLRAQADAFRALLLQRSVQVAELEREMPAWSRLRRAA